VEEARQHSTLITGRFGALIFLLIAGELLSAVAVLVLGFAGREVFVAVNAFGIFLAARAVALIVHGLMKGTIFFPTRPIQRDKQPLRFWLLMVVRLITVGVGIFLTQIPIG
jgi:hypothetical protein